MRTTGLLPVLASIAASLVAACGTAAPDPTPPASLVVPINVARKNAVDVLFLIDDSNSMDSMQKYLRDSFYQFFRPFDDLAARGTFIDFHIGVVTSDLGAGISGAPGCAPGGPRAADGGRLIAMGKKASAECMPPQGKPYIEFAYAPNGATRSNLPKGLGLAQTFTCMASIGSNGCGFEHQLESVYQALKHPVAGDEGFLRKEAVLAVVFLTNEDDASAPPESVVFDKNRVAQFGYEASYPRQTRLAIECGNPPDFPPYTTPKGPLADCRPVAKPDHHYGVQRYIDFFTLPKAKGGVKDDPADVILYAIDGPETPFEVILSNPHTPAGQPYLPCRALNESSNPPCVPVLQHSCVNLTDPNLFGDPAVRLNTVVNAAPTHKIWSICDENYVQAMSEVAVLTTQAALGSGCLPESAVGPGGEAACRVSDVTEDVDHESATDLARCVADGPRPCWRVEPKAICDGRSSGGWGLTIDRAGANPPDNTHARASCDRRPD